MGPEEEPLCQDADRRAESSPSTPWDEEEGVGTGDNALLEARLVRDRWQWRILVVLPMSLAGLFLLLALGTITFAAIHSHQANGGGTTDPTSSSGVVNKVSKTVAAPSSASSTATSTSTVAVVAPGSRPPAQVPPPASAITAAPTAAMTLVRSSAFHENDVPLFRHSRVPDPKCPHFITHRLVTNAGIGHLITEYLTGIALTLAKPGATFVYKDSLATKEWEGHLSDREAAHGDVAWADDFFRLGLGEAEYTQITEQYHPNVMTYGNSPCDGNFMEQCNGLCNWWGYLCEWKDELGTSGTNHLCISRFHQGFDEMKHIMRYKFRHTLYEPKAPLLFQPHHYNVAWHLRSGDLIIHGNEPQWFMEVARQVRILLEGFDTKIHFFSESPGSGTAPPSIFAFLSDVVPDAMFVNDLDAPATLYHFANADMVITSGSSFSFLTGLISPKPVILETIAKEGAEIDFYQIQDSLKLDEYGTLSGTTLDVARAEVLDQYELYHTVQVPPAHAHR